MMGCLQRSDYVAARHLECCCMEARQDSRWLGKGSVLAQFLRIRETDLSVAIIDTYHCYHLSARYIKEYWSAVRSANGKGLRFNVMAREWSGAKASKNKSVGKETTSTVAYADDGDPTVYWAGTVEIVWACEKNINQQERTEVAGMEAKYCSA